MHTPLGTMTTSPTRVLLRRQLLTAVTGLMMATSGANADAAEQLFVCGSGVDGAQDETLLELRAESSVNDDWTDLTFRGYWPGHLSVYYPDAGEIGDRTFLFANSTGPEGYVVTIRFWIGQDQFRLYSIYKPPQHDDHGIGRSEAGLEITSPGGAVRRIVCDERPTMFIESLRAAAGCDGGTILGTAACDTDRVPVRASGQGLW